jgi:hypothetical protein
MMNVESYRQYAVDCVRKAQGEETPEDRNILLNVALAWLRLAQQTETMDGIAADGSEAGDESGEAAAAAEDGAGEDGIGEDQSREDEPQDQTQGETRRLAS